MVASVESKSGTLLFVQQFKAVIHKNALISVRNKRAFILQLASSFWFILLLFAVDRAIQTRLGDGTEFRNLFQPQAVTVKPIPPCESGYFIKDSCYDFVYSGQSISTVRSIVSSIMAKNPGRSIAATKVQGFDTPADVDKWLLSNPMLCTGALHFEQRGANVIAFGVQTNNTAKQKRGTYEDTLFDFQLPLQAAAEREIARFLAKDPNFDVKVSLSEFAHPAISTFSTVGTFGPSFLFAAAMFSVVIQISSLVQEKELKLRQAMSTMGLLDSVYWLTWLAWEVMLALPSSLLLVIFGMIFQFDFFLHNNFGVLFFTFFLFQFNMIGFAFLVSTFIRKTSTANSAGFCIFVIGFVTQMVTNFGFPYDNSFPTYYQALWSLFPPNLLAIALNYLGDATSTKQDEGIKWSNRTKCSPHNGDCVLTMDEIFQWLTGSFFLWFALAIYFDNILPDSNGVRKSCFYFLQKSYWTGISVNNSVEEPAVNGVNSGNEGVDEDVLTEEKHLKEQVRGVVDPNISVQIQGLRKTFPGVKRKVGICSRVRTQPFHAIKGLWLNIENNKLFCLLGPNGAGKTTIINCLTGILPPTAGDALVNGLSVRNANSMAQIRHSMGVCPQFDILWDQLSGREHLHLFANIKGLLPSKIKSSCEEVLERAKLLDVAKVRAQSYSGGMKRRLSVAIALIGDPKIVYLDEPTTGMDPVTRRHVWDIIETAKEGRAVILTTHSMEEADVLADRIAIMAKGKLQCIGTSIHLKSKFGTGYIVNCTMEEDSSEDSDAEAKANRVKDLFRAELGIEAKEEGRGYISFVIPRHLDTVLVDFFGSLELKQKELCIRDIQLSLTTLEEVFLKISRNAELEVAAAEGRYETLVLDDGTHLQVEVGAEYAEGNGRMVKVEWEQDDRGALCISGHSEMPRM